MFKPYFFSDHDQTHRGRNALQAAAGRNEIGLNVKLSFVPMNMFALCATNSVPPRHNLDVTMSKFGFVIMREKITISTVR